MLFRAWIALISPFLNVTPLFVMKRTLFFRLACIGFSCAVLSFFSVSSLAFPREFIDVSSSHWAYDIITEAAVRKVAKGYEDGSFRPNHSATNAHVSAFFSRAFYPSGITDGTVTSSDLSYLNVQNLRCILSNQQTIKHLSEAPNEHVSVYDLAQIMYDILVDYNILDASQPLTMPSLESLHLLDSASSEYYLAVSSIYSLGLLDGMLDLFSHDFETISRVQACAAAIRLSDYIMSAPKMNLSGLIVGGQLSVTNASQDHVTFVLENNGKELFSYAGIPVLKRYENKDWVTVPSLSGSFTDIAILRQLSAGQKKEIYCDLAYRYGALSSGLYRLDLEISQGGNNYFLSDIFSIQIDV